MYCTEPISKTPNTPVTATQQPITSAATGVRIDHFATGASVASHLGNLIRPITVLTLDDNSLTGTETVKAVVTVRKAFKTVIRALSLIGEHLGPIAGGICAIVPVFQEGSPTATLDKVDNGFKEIHHRFGLLQDQLNNRYRSEQRVRGEYLYMELQNYKSTVQDPLLHIKATFSSFDSSASMSGHSNLNMNELYKLLNVCKDGEKSPLSIIQSLNHCMTNSGDRPLGDELMYHTRAERRMLHVFLISRANELAQLVAFNTRCALYRYMYVEKYIRAFPDPNLALTSQVDTELSKIEQQVAEGFEIFRDVTYAILRLDERHTYSWQKDVAEGMTTMTSGSGLTASRLASWLTTVYNWNYFQVTILTAYQEEETMRKDSSIKILQYTWLTNPDYSLVHKVPGRVDAAANTRERWTRYVIVNWVSFDGDTNVSTVQPPTIEAWLAFGISWEPRCLFSSDENIKSFFKFRSFDHVEEQDWDSWNSGISEYSHTLPVDSSGSVEGFPLVSGKREWWENYDQRAGRDKKGPTIRCYKKYITSTYCMALAGYGY